MTYDILFFEALGEENGHLEEEIQRSKEAGTLPKDLRYYIGTETLQEYLAAHPDEELPVILSSKTHSVFPDSWLHEGAKKSILSRSAGYDHVEAFQDIAHVASLRNYCVNAVAETALKLVMMACGNVNEYQKNAATLERNNCISFKEATGLKAVVFGVGKIGRRIYELLDGIGMDTYGVDIRAEELTEEYNGKVRFISPEEALDADVIVCGMCSKKDPASRFYNENYFSREFLEKTKKGLVLVNVTRGELWDAEAVLDLYDKGHIFGIGTDVFAREAQLTKVVREGAYAEDPKTRADAEMIRRSLAREANIYTQAHQAFNSDKAAWTKAKETLRHLEAWYRNGGYFDEELPYYN